MSEPFQTSSEDAHASPASPIWVGELWLLSARLLQDAFAVWADFWTAPLRADPGSPTPEEPFLEPARLVGID